MWLFLNKLLTFPFNFITFLVELGEFVVGVRFCLTRLSPKLILLASREFGKCSLNLSEENKPVISPHSKIVRNSSSSGILDLDGLDTPDEDPVSSCSELLLFCRVFVHSKSLNSRPQIIMMRKTPARTIQAPRQPLHFSTKNWVNSANTKVPTPDPQTDIPVSKDRLASK